jgi:hypothetical protein
MSDVKFGETRTLLAVGLIATFLSLALLPSACLSQDVAVTMFGPKQYLRTKNSVDVYTDTFPAAPGNGIVMIRNGDGTGHKLVSDILIQINGTPLLDWSLLMHPGYKLQDPISLQTQNEIEIIILGKPGSYVTVQFKAKITPDATTTQVIGIGGGSVSVQNHLGDTFTARIPPLALNQDASISVSALPNALPGPIANSAYPGAILEPEGLLFNLPVTMEVAFHGTLPNSIPAMLLWYEGSSHVLPISKQTTTQNSVAGQQFHFSTETAGFPTADELSTIVTSILTNAAAEQDSDVNAAAALVSIAVFAQQAEFVDPAYTNIGEWAWTTAQTLATNAATAELQKALPADPCGQKVTTDDVQLAVVLQQLGLETLAAEILARDCTLEVLPPAVSLFEGETWNNNITATLKGPHGYPRSCSPLWYDSNPSAATIAASGNACVPTGVGPGVADVSASCDGVTSSSIGSTATTVSVCSMTGTFQGSYSGSKITCAQKDSNGCCTQWGGPKVIAAPITVTFSQNGTSVSTNIDGYDLSGTNVNGNVSLSTTVPAACRPVSFPAGIDGTLSSDCSTFSGSFYVDRSRTIQGSFSVTRLPQ